MIRVKIFDTIGPDLNAFEAFLNETGGTEKIIDIGITYDSRGNHGAVVTYEDGEIAADH